jgi:putative NADH-flavin reductase
MNITLFGATGATGKLLTEGCLKAGHKVKILARDPSAFPLAAQLEAVRGDAKDITAVREALRGADVVLSALGARSLRKEDILEDAVPLIVQAMQEQGIRRIIVLGSAGALDSALDKQPAYRRWIVQHIVYNTFLKHPVASQRAQYAALSTSGLEWTMVMPPMLLNAPARGKLRIDGDALPRGASRISRADVADFMMAQIGSTKWVPKGVYIAW